MCTTEDCNNDDTPSNGIERRTFLTGVTAAAVGVTLASERLAQTPTQPPTNALNDPKVIQGLVSFRSGADLIQGYLARPGKAGRFPAVVILHGSLHLPEDSR